ncbi:MAG: EamA family transporter [Thiolinea sp.]
MRYPHQLLALLVTFIWGTNFVFIRHGLEELPAFEFAALRFLLTAFPLVFFFPRPQVPWRWLAAYGVLIGFGQFGLLFWAMKANISPGLASLVVQVQVFFTILLAALLFAEPVRTRQKLALLISFAGLALIALFTDGQTTLLGLGLVLLAALSWAGGNLVSKRVGKVNIIAFLAWSSLFAVPPLFLMSLTLEGPALMQQAIQQASLNAWLVVLWQTIGNTLIGYGLWNYLLNHYPAVLVTPWALLVPVFGMSASALMLAEPMPWWKLLATALILAGLFMNISRPPRVLPA